MAAKQDKAYKAGTIEVGAQAVFSKGINGVITNVVSWGSDGPAKDDTGGTGEGGSNAVVDVMVYAGSAEDVVMTAGGWHSSVKGVQFNLYLDADITLLRSRSP